MNLRSKIGLLATLLCLSTEAWSVPATREPIIRILVDGSSDTTWLHGDEYYHYRTNSRGEIIDGSEYIDESHWSGEHAMAKAPQRTMLTSYVPKRGKVRIPVLLVNFTDLSFTLSDPKTQFEDLFNGQGGSNPYATGSVHDYFTASSDGALDLEYEVFGPFDLEHEMAYYGANKTNSEGVVINHNIRARELVVEAVRIATDAGVDLSPYDNNADGTIDNISIIVAGYNEAEGGPENSIWPHYSALENSSKYSGKFLSGYLMISEYRSSGGKVQAGIGTYCHEFGHALGLPDLYDTQRDRYTVGYWDIMCSGSYNNNGSTPPSYTAFERFMLGWLTPQQVSTAGGHTLAPIETGNEALLIAAETHNMNAGNPNPTEYFLLENRQSIGWDAGNEALVSTGLLITHITFNSSTWNSNTFNNSDPLGFAIVSAGMSQQTQSSKADVFPGSTMRTTWLPTLNDGKMLSDLTVSQIRQRADLTMTLQVGNTGTRGVQFSADEVQMETTYLYDAVEYDTAKVDLEIDAIPYDTLLLFASSPLFRFSTDQGKTWTGNKDTAILAIHRDSAYSTPVWIIHRPTRRVCTYSYAFLNAETPDMQYSAQMTVSGRSPRPTYITAPELDSISAVTSSTFAITWKEQEDAELYYYTLYSLGEGSSEETEGFELFNSQDMINKSGWTATFVNSQSTVAHTGNAVLFNQSGQMIQSPLYMYAPKQVSLWISNNLTPNTTDETTGGRLTITGTADGTTWETVGVITVLRTTKDIVRTLDVDSTRNLRQFRIIYEHLGGNGGVAVDDWTVHYAYDIQYIHRLYEYTIYAPEHTAIFRELSPNTTYYVALQAYEEKGCEPHFSALSEPFEVRTRAINDLKKLTVAKSGEQYRVLLPEVASGLQYIGVYDHDGRLVTTIPLTYGATEAEVPTAKLVHGNVYLLKLCSRPMKRGDISGKLFYY